MMNTFLIITTIYLGIGSAIGYYLLAEQLKTRRLRKKIFPIVFILIFAVSWFSVIVKLLIDKVKVYFKRMKGSNRNEN